MYFCLIMIGLLSATLILSVIHALIPNHWLPLVAVANAENKNDISPKFKNAVEMSLKASDGVMIFDIVHIIQNGERRERGRNPRVVAEVLQSWDGL